MLSRMQTLDCRLTKSNKPPLPPNLVLETTRVRRTLAGVKGRWKLLALNLSEFYYVESFQWTLRLQSWEVLTMRHLNAFYCHVFAKRAYQLFLLVLNVHDYGVQCANTAILQNFTVWLFKLFAIKQISKRKIKIKNNIIIGRGIKITYRKL